jgi:hypothetical protein
MSLQVDSGMTPRPQNGFEEVKRFLDIDTITQNKRNCLDCRTLFVAPPVPSKSKVLRLVLSSLIIYIGSGKAESTIGTNRKTMRKGAVAWKDTHCAKILKTAKPGTSYFHRKSIVASEGDVVHLNSHVGFRQATDGQVNYF